MVESVLFPKKAVFLSPHSDDICFSASRMARVVETGVLLTIFSRCAYTVAHPLNLSDESIARVSALRKGEDVAFANACGLQSSSLELDEAPLRGLQPFQPSTPQELAYVERPLMSWLEQHAGISGRALLLAPAGVGGHVDHLTVRDAVVKNITILSTHYVVCFYEDLHYASDPIKLQHGQAALLAALPRSVVTARVQTPLSESDSLAKLGLIGLYRSQIRQQPINLLSYTPGGSFSVTHEALWVTMPCGSDR